MDNLFNIKSINNYIYINPYLAGDIETVQFFFD